MKSSVIFLTIVYVTISVEAVNVLIGSGVSSTEKQSILDTHNTLRTWIAQGIRIQSQPKAGNMQKLAWDDGLEQVAQNWTDQMILDHNPYKSDPRWPAIGENLGWGTDPKFDFTRCILLWFDEYQNYTFGPMTMSSFIGPYYTGHYTQVVWAKSQYIGCGASYFHNTDDGRRYKLYVCNYGPSGNYIGAKPYYPGPGCSDLCCEEEYGNLYANCTTASTTSTGSPDTTAIAGTPSTTASTEVPPITASTGTLPTGGTLPPPYYRQFKARPSYQFN